MVEKYIFYAGYQKPKTIVPLEQKLSVLVQGDILVECEHFIHTYKKKKPCDEDDLKLNMQPVRPETFIAFNGRRHIVSYGAQTISM